MNKKYEYYTVDRAGTLQKELENYGNLILLNPRINSEEVREKIENIQKLFPNGLSRHGVSYLNSVHPNALNENNKNPSASTNALIEMVFEFIRRIYFPQLPSRFESVFGFETKEDCQNFIRDYGQGYENAKIFKFISETKGFKADMAWLKSGNSYADTINYAFQYWNGKSTENPQWEILIKLPVGIKEVD